jgi:hypothetical protein
MRSSVCMVQINKSSMRPGVCMVQINKSWMRPGECMAQINKSWMRPGECMVQINKSWMSPCVRMVKINKSWMSPCVRMKVALHTVALTLTLDCHICVWSGLVGSCCSFCSALSTRPLWVSYCPFFFGHAWSVLLPVYDFWVSPFDIFKLFLDNKWSYLLH